MFSFEWRSSLNVLNRTNFAKDISEPSSDFETSKELIVSSQNGSSPFNELRHCFHPLRCRLLSACVCVCVCTHECHYHTNVVFRFQCSLNTCLVVEKYYFSWKKGWPWKGIQPQNNPLQQIPLDLYEYGKLAVNRMMRLMMIINRTH